MIQNLHIKNYALIEDLYFDFSPGINIFTGETGAGKSIVIESLALILGERASSQTVRKGASRCFISGEFDISNNRQLIKFLQNSGVDDTTNENIILRREVDITGKSRAFINDIPISIDTLQKIGAYLVDIHGQNDHQTLLKTAQQRQLLDTYGDLEDLCCDVSNEYEKLSQLITQQNAQKISEQEKERLIELYSFQKKEIDDAKLEIGEEEEITNTLPTLKNADKLINLSQETYEILYGSEGSVIDRLNKVQKLLENINNISGTLNETLENFNKTYYQLEEVVNEIEDFKDKIKIDPESLNQLLQRQDLIHRLKKKYGSNIQEIISYRDKVSDELDSLTKSEEKQQELECRINETRKTLYALSEKLSVSRKKTSTKLAQEVQNELKDLGMKNAEFEINIIKNDEPTKEGFDKIEFTFSANPGENPKPLRFIASGGETSRVMLGLKTVLAKADRIPILIFDEIDAGIGGPMGQVVGKKLKNLSKHHQILCITHLPQIAAYADNHLSVEKQINRGQTLTKVNILNEKQRLEEIARMLSGTEVTSSARKHAAELIQNS